MSFLLDPDATLDFEFDWTPWLDSGETISSHTVAATSGVTVQSDSESDGKVTVWLTAGQDGATPSVTCHIVTSAGRTDDRTMYVRVLQR